MTTIVYDHENKQIACDSRETAGNFICSDSVMKYRQMDDCIWFVAGYSSDVDILIDTAKHNAVAPENVEVLAILVKNKEATLVTIADGVYKFDKLTSHEGIGSGGRSAVCAIDFGNGAKVAVEYAITRDTMSGGKVHVYDIEKGEFI